MFVLAALALPATASAALPLLWQVPEGAPASGSGAGEISVTRGVAVDPASGHVYVASVGNARIEEFTPWGEFVKAFGWNVDAGAPAEEPQVCTEATGCQAGTVGSGPGQFDNPEGLTVDSAGNLYAVDKRNQRVQKFDADGDFVLMFGGEVNQDTSANLCTAASGDSCGKGATGTANGQFAPWPTFAAGAQYIDAGPGDAIHVGDENRIQIFDSEGVYQSEIATPAPGKTQAIAVDSAGNLYFTFNQDYNKHGEEAELPNIYKHNGSSWSVFAETEYPKALATDEDGHLYAIDAPIAPNNIKEPERVVEYSPSGARLIPSDLELEQNAGKKIGSVPFFAQKPGFGLTGLATSDACNLESADVFVSYQGGGASALVAYGPNPNPDVCPPPVRPPAITDQFVSSVEEEGALLRAKVNSRFWPSTTYHVEYGTEPCSLGGCAAKPAPPGIALESSSSTAVPTKGVTLSGLQPGTTYHYRFVATTVYEPGPGGEATVKGVGGEVGIDGAEGEFTTPEPTLSAKTNCPNQAFRTSLSAPLPDCRAYELVSPVDKEGGDIVALINVTGYRASRFQSATSGERFTYSTYAPFGAVQAGAYTQQYIASRAAGKAWSSESINPPRGRALFEPGFTSDTEFKAFSPDLCRGWLRLDFESEGLLDPAAVPGFSNLFRRESCAAGAGGYEALTTVEPPDATTATYTRLELQGMSAAGDEAIFVTAGQLTPDAPFQATCASEKSTCQQRLYHHSAGGQLRYVCYLPNGTTPSDSCYAGNGSNVGGQGRRNQLTGALSADGSRVFFNLGGALYLRLNADAAPSESGQCEEEEPDAACTIAIPGGTQFWAAAADGSRVIYETSTGALREYDVEEGATSTIAASGVLGVLGQSADATRVYFASTAALAPGAEAGEPNLYFREAGEATRFVATLSAADVESSKEKAVAITDEPIERATRVTLDGLSAAFVSSASLTGYDNTDAVSGKPDQQVFLYDAEAEEGEGRLVCASCDPSGARPVGKTGSAKPWKGVLAAAWIPTWEGDLYPSRPLSDDGSRLFFNSFGPLVTRDTNGRQDVYQWQAAESKAECEAAGAERHVPSSHGCLSLISSGESPQDSEFLDADPSARNVFLATGASLLSHDPDQIDVYDARQGGGLPPPSGIGAECEGGACQAPAPAPQLSTPASAAYRGPGNAASRRTAARCARPARKAKRLGTRAKGLRGAAARSQAPAAKRRRLRAARRSSAQARRLSRGAKRCRARARRAER